MNARLVNLEWSRFLARPRLPSPEVEVLDALYRLPILITGAGGSIGSALAQRVASLAPTALLLLDSSESRLYQLQQNWISECTPGRMMPILGSVGDRMLLSEIFTVHAPRLVFHAAAFKHVPLMEEQPLAAIATNVFGTQSLVRSAAAHDARVVLLSTDKAVEPCSIMGATKRLAERIVLAAGGTALRMGNVLATRDSVTEVFAQQIAIGYPLTVTDPGARRYFLTIDEAINMLLIAAAEPAAPILLAPELSSPHFITDLAHFVAQELAPERQIELDFTSPRPGDKEIERLWSSTEFPRPSRSKGLLRIDSPQNNEDHLEAALARLRGAVEARDLPAALGHLCELVPDYTPSPAVMSLAGNRVAP